ncbi:hypothetical protein KY334_02360, partial [Candidatus Woesearchaeota archaeon]|nr:hypothetical protein [Candidatus Woesearchaeota archaeon]
SAQQSLIQKQLESNKGLMIPGGFTDTQIKAQESLAIDLEKNLKNAEKTHKDMINSFKSEFQKSMQIGIANEQDLAKQRRKLYQETEDTITNIAKKEVDEIKKVEFAYEKMQNTRDSIYDKELSNLEKEKVALLNQQTELKNKRNGVLANYEENFKRVENKYKNEIEKTNKLFDKRGVAIDVDIPTRDLSAEFKDRSIMIKNLQDEQIKNTEILASRMRSELRKTQSLNIKDREKASSKIKSIIENEINQEFFKKNKDSNRYFDNARKNILENVYITENTEKFREIHQKNINKLTQEQLEIEKKIGNITKYSDKLRNLQSKKEGFFNKQLDDLLDKREKDILSLESKRAKAIEDNNQLEINRLNSEIKNRNNLFNSEIMRQEILSTKDRESLANKFKGELHSESSLNELRKMYRNKAHQESLKEIKGNEKYSKQWLAKERSISKNVRNEIIENNKKLQMEAIKSIALQEVKHINSLNNMKESKISFINDFSIKKNGSKLKEIRMKEIENIKAISNSQLENTKKIHSNETTSSKNILDERLRLQKEYNEKARNEHLETLKNRYKNDVNFIKKQKSTIAPKGIKLDKSLIGLAKQGNMANITIGYMISHLKSAWIQSKKLATTTTISTKTVNEFSTQVEKTNLSLRQLSRNLLRIAKTSKIAQSSVTALKMPLLGIASVASMASGMIVGMAIEMAIFGGMTFVMENWREILEYFKNVLNKSKESILDVINTMKKLEFNVSGLMTFISSLRLLDIILQLSVFQGFSHFIEVLYNLIDIIFNLSKSLIYLIKIIFTFPFNLIEKILNIFGIEISFVEIDQNVNKFKQSIENTLKGIVQIFDTYMKDLLSIKSLLTTIVIGMIKPFIMLVSKSNIVTSFLVNFKSLWILIVNILSKLPINNIVNLIKVIIPLGYAFSMVFIAGYTFGKWIMEFIPLVEKLINVFEFMKLPIIDFTEMKKSFLNAGYSLVESFSGGIKSGINLIVNAIQYVFSSILDYLPHS